MISSAAWWKLRDQFQKSLPGNVSRSYLATVLGIEERSAANLLGPFRTVGIIESDGKPTERANHWRFDQDYRGVCDSIVEAVYPEELRQAIPTPSTNEDGAIRWFMRSAGVGKAGARKMAATYQLIAESDPASRIEPQPAKALKPKRQRTQPTPHVRASDQKAVPAVQPQPAAPTATTQHHRSEGPTLHIDVQIHIAADASAEQIDQIFASMAKHIYGKE